ncbi:MAG: glutamate mutase L, partial [Actinomycetota bacterium]|nr:glutamate mutase L [Actinomycetota bacterium]
ALLTAAGVPRVRAANVVPRIGVLQPEPARAAIRAMFLSHVIGGKGLSRRSNFTAMVRGATPDVVLTAVELLAGLAGDVAVVDIGGATTDVHSVVAPDPEDRVLAREVVAPTALGRTVEGDLGVRWSAVSTVEAAEDAGLVTGQEHGELLAGASRRQGDPAYLPDSDAEDQLEARLATLAGEVALRRHAGRQLVTFGPDGRLVERTGKDLREIGLLVGSGGVLRHHPPKFATSVLRAWCGHIPGGWLLPRKPALVVDRDYVLAAAGLLAADHPEAASALVQDLACGGGRPTDGAGV